MLPIVEVQVVKVRAVLIISASALLFFYSFAPSFQNQEWVLLSPDKKVSIKVQLTDGKVTYAASYSNQTAIEQSPLGIVRQDHDLSTRMTFVSKSETTIDERYTLMVGKRAQCRGLGTQLVLNFENQFKKRL